MIYPSAICYLVGAYLCVQPAILCCRWGLCYSAENMIQPSPFCYLVLSVIWSYLLFGPIYYLVLSVVWLEHKCPTRYSVLQVGTICNNAEITETGLRGQPTEGALLACAMKVSNVSAG
jgi:hypothetical protein